MKHAFTLIEMLLAMVIILGLIAISVPVFSELNTRADLDAGKEIVEIVLRKAQAQARNQKNNSNWGVYLDSSNNRIIVFSGESYDTRTQSLDELFSLPTDVSINNNEPLEVVFEQLTGDSSAEEPTTIPIQVSGITKTLAVSSGSGIIQEVFASENEDWLDGWQYRKKITIDETKIDADLTHFPVTVVLDDDSDFFDELGVGDGKKVVFTKSDGKTQLYAELEQFDDPNTKAVYHVSGSDWILSSTTPTEFYIYYDSTQLDNTTYVGDQGSTAAQSVWDSNFAGVWHKNDGASQVMVDSTSNRVNGIKKSTNNPLEADAKIGKGQDYSSDDVRAGILSVGNEFTAEVWIQADSLGGPGELNTYGNTIMSSSGGGQGYPLWVSVGIGGSTEVTLRAFTSGVTPQNTTDAGLNTTDWFHIVATATQNSTAKIYVNGVEKLSGSAGNTNWSNEFTLGDLRRNRAIYFDGSMDESRVSNNIRSEAWVKATYHSGNGTLITSGGEEIQ